MILCIGHVLTPEELDAVVSNLEITEFVDGKATAGWHAKLVKHNTQAQADAPPVVAARKVINAALKRNAVFQMAVRPKAIRPLLFNRYEQGMSYGAHIDNALMGDRDLLRSDVSLTLFLSSPGTYAGGELVIEDTQGEQAYKLEAGAMMIYPSSTLHRVEPVTSGVRLAAVTWIQSLVRDAGDREILFDLDTARQAIFQQHGKTREFDLISKSHANLLRKWAEV
jgi:PKHD-type hydroxylase